MRKLFYLQVFLLFFISWCGLAAKTTVDIEKNPKFEDVNLGEGEAVRFTKDFQRKIDKNGPNFTDSFFLQNALGYTIGSPHINTFEAGFALGTVAANGGYFKDRARSETYPAFTPIISFHAGFPLDSKTDVTGKIALFDLFLVDQEPTVRDVKIEDFRQLSLGAKIRRQLATKRKILPFLFNFEGFTVGSSFDMQTGYMGVEGDYDVDMPQTTIDPGDGELIAIDTHLEGDYDAISRWLQFSVAGDAVGYFSVMNVLTMYSGFGLALGWSWFGMEAESSGELMTEDESANDAIGGGFDYRTDHMMVLNYESSTMFHPFPLLPMYIYGIETNISGVRLTLETIANLKNLKDVALIFGIRYQM